MIVVNTKTDLNPALLDKCAAFFIENNVYDKAALLYILVGKCEEVNNIFSCCKMLIFRR